jgi:hypothetical protein
VGAYWSKAFGNVFELGYNYSFFPFAQTAAKTFPDTTISLRQTLRTWAIELNLFQRFSIKRKPPRPGTYIDIGAGVDWAIMMGQVRRLDGTDGSKVKLAETRLPYRRSFYYSFLARLGFGNFFLFGEYRMSPLIKPGYGDPGLPQLAVGLGLTPGP